MFHEITHAACIASESASQTPDDGRCSSYADEFGNTTPDSLPTETGYDPAHWNWGEDLAVSLTIIYYGNKLQHWKFSGGFYDQKLLWFISWSEYAPADLRYSWFARHGGLQSYDPTEFPPTH